VRIPTDTPPGDNAPHARPWPPAGKLGLEVEHHPVSEQQVRDYGMRSITNLIVRRRYSKDGPTIALNAHGDVVPPGDGWSKPPYEGVVENGRLYGRAAAVSKSDFSTYLYAVRALEAWAQGSDTPRLRGGIELHFTYDEEFGGLLGPGYLLEQGLTKPDYALCAAFSYQVVTAHNGCLQFEVTVNGKATHGSMPKTGHDALQAATRICRRTMPMRRGWTNPIVHPGILSPTAIVGRIDGGTNTNVVPGKVVLKLDRRMIPEEDPAQVETDVRVLIDQPCWLARHLSGRAPHSAGARIAPLPGHEQMVTSLQRHASAVFGEDFPAVGTPLYADARLYGEHGIPVVIYGAGPRTLMESRAKQADENVALADLRGATR